ncbi:MAG: hypothetical protein J7619_14530 [Dyadobacter sp.]|uniref:hypothetical protein n=1 Tax=Dyadobacter sp. TaxID=1914288 RepID=UPI001B1C5C16|nr:hypothetical protein [Dyadobacter sp.]MBO9613916.1 hypothetical protein [Dyadobacter sp.]
MKKLFLLLLPGMLLLAGQAEAQLQKGTTHFGATIGASGDGARSKSSSGPVEYSDKSNSHGIAPSLQTGWMIRDNRMFGFRLTSGIVLRNTKYEGTGPLNHFVNNNYSLSLSPFIRHYKSINSKWALFLQSGVEGSYVWSKTKTNDAVEKENGYTVGLYVLPGITYWISPRFAIESDLRLLSLAANYTDFNDSKTFTFNAGITSGINSYFGVRAAWYLQKSN